MIYEFPSQKKEKKKRGTSEKTKIYLDATILLDHQFLAGITAR